MAKSAINNTPQPRPRRVRCDMHPRLSDEAPLGATTYYLLIEHVEPHVRTAYLPSQRYTTRWEWRVRSALATEGSRS